MYYQRLSDEEILSGFREGDAEIIREYFYGYCQVGYNIFDQRYQLREKENLDFMSLAHQYALYLMEHDWKPLEDHSPNVSLKTWLINGFRYVVLDALKWYRKEYGQYNRGLSRRIYCGYRETSQPFGILHLYFFHASVG